MVDFFISIFCLLCLLKGILRGTVNEAISIAGIFICLFVASTYYAEISLFIFSWIDTLQIRNLCGFLLTFGFIGLVINFLAVIATYLLHIKVSGVGSRLAGAGVGTLKGILLISALLIPLVAFLPRNSEYIKDSTLFSLESTLSKEMVSLMPKGMQKVFTNKIGDYLKVWHHKNRADL